MSLDCVNIVYQDRIFPSPEEKPFLDSYMQWFQVLKRTLFNSLYGNNRPSNLNEFKREFIKKYEVTSTYYNCLKTECDTIFKSQIELQKHYRDELKSKEKSIKDWIEHKENVIQKSQFNLQTKTLKEDHKKRILSKIKISKFKLHHKKRKLAKVRYQINSYENKVKQGTKYVPKIVFGSKSLLRKRHELRLNGYQGAEQWKKDWCFYRSNSALFVGDSTEEHRNRQVKGITSFQHAEVADLKIAVPYFLRHDFGESKTFTLKAVQLSARTLNQVRSCLEFIYKKEIKSKDGTLTFRDARLPITYRFKKEKYLKNLNGNKVEDERYYIQTIIKMPKEPQSSYDAGAIGIDLNVDHLAIGVVDRFGNPKKSFSLPFRPYEASNQQNEAALGAIINDLCDLAEKRQAPLVVEKLKLSLLMAKLKHQHFGKTSKKLSALSYAKFFDMCETICARRKVKLLRVFAGFSSQLGAINYLHLKSKVTSHETAAFVIARRGISKKDYLDISTFKYAPDGQEILSQTQERLAGPAIKSLRKISKKIDFRELKGSYLHFNPGKYEVLELDSLRSHVFSPKTVFRDSA